MHSLAEQIIHSMEYATGFWPLSFFLICLISLIAIAMISPALIEKIFTQSKIAKALALFAVATVICYGLLYLLLPVLGDCIVPQISAVSYRVAFSHGSVYAPRSTSMVLGPATYLLQIPSLWLLGGNLFATKITGVLAFLTALGLIHKAIQTHATSISEPIVALGLIAGAFIYFQYVSFWDRPEPLLLLCVAVPMWMIQTERRGVFLATCIAAGIAIDLKVTAFLYFIPIFALLPKATIRKTVLGILAMAALIVVPFCFSSVSLFDYLGVLHSISKHGIDSSTFLLCVQTAALFLIFPINSVILRINCGPKVNREELIHLALLLLAVGAVCIVGGKPGAGPHHLIPFLAILPCTYFKFRGPCSAEALHTKSFMLISLSAFFANFLLSAISLANVAHNLPVEAKKGALIKTEVESILHDYSKSSIEVGYGDSAYEEATFYRNLPVFHGEPYTLDAISMQELEFHGDMREFDGLNKDIEECRPGVWLIPKGEAPFVAHSGYDPKSQIFDTQFRELFVSHYHLVETRKIFDIWRCTAHS